MNVELVFRLEEMSVFYLRVKHFQFCINIPSTTYIYDHFHKPLSIRIYSKTVVVK